MYINANDKKYCIQISKYKSTNVSGENVVYFIEAKKAIILNKTGTIIWDMINIPDSDGTVDIEDITSKIMSEFGYDADLHDRVRDDIFVPLRKLSENGLITLEEISE